MSVTSEGRRAQIMTLIKDQGRISVPALAEQMKVSQETIRRDLKLLEESGSLRRVHGGAVLPSLLIEQPVTERLGLHRVAKDRIAAKAVELIQEDMSLFLDPSSTAIALAHALVGFHKLTIVTNSLEVARIVGERSSNRLIVIGGLYKREDAAMFGFDPFDGRPKLTGWHKAAMATDLGAESDAAMQTALTEYMAQQSAA